MKPRYILRLDDVHARMKHQRFERFCEILDRFRIKPLIGVIPVNRDEALNFDDVDPFFFEKIRGLQNRGYSIALHGYEHKYTSSVSGLMGINSYSEFAGLPYDEQLTKIRAAVAKFSQEGIRVESFMAPAHSFDRNTMLALKDCGVSVITDGFYLFPHKLYDLFLLPQQFWRFREIRLPGLFTFCFHIDFLSDEAFESFLIESEGFFKSHKDKFESPRDVVFKEYDKFYYRWANYLFRLIYTAIFCLKNKS